MLHPVGRLPARVYWRRRLVLLAVVVGLLAGGGWLTLRLLERNASASSAAAATTSSTVPTPALEQVLPSLAAVRTPDTAPGTPAPETRRTAAPKTAGPTPGGRCTDDMIELGLRARKSVPAGSKVDIELVVRNVSDVPCVRRIDTELQEIVLLDSDGDRVWGSNDCLREESDRGRTLEPQEGVALPVEWSGRTSEPTCTRERTAPDPGVYVLRGRLDDKKTPERRLRLT